MKRHLLFLGLLAFGASLVLAGAPSWWSTEATRILSADSSDNYAPANLGQLKLVAKKAMEYLDLYLPGGAGSDIAEMVAAFEPRLGQGYTPQQISQFKAANYAPANLGQLKAVAKPFYDRLLAAGYDTRQNLIAHGAGGWLYDYPWLWSNPATPDPANYAPANIGQLKFVFSFDISTDTENDGLMDWWEQHFFGDLAQSANGDFDEDGVSNAWEFLLASNPTLADSNGDGLLDVTAWQTQMNSTAFDTDDDGLSNAQELLLGTNPIVRDTDGDGVIDGQDAFPLDPANSQMPGANPNDHGLPNIVLVRPPDAVLLPP